MQPVSADTIFVTIRTEGDFTFREFPTVSVLHSQPSDRSIFVLKQCDSETAHRLLCHNMCLTPSFAVLPLWYCYVLNLLLVFDIFSFA